MKPGAASSSYLPTKASKDFGSKSWTSKVPASTASATTGFGFSTNVMESLKNVAAKLSAMLVESKPA